MKQCLNYRIKANGRNIYLGKNNYYALPEQF